MHGAGNDFIVVDDRARVFPLNDVSFIEKIASRRTGIGCDGILLLQPSEAADFRMRFINPDGNEVEMCGNGARCIARFAHGLGTAPSGMKIETSAGIVCAEVLGSQVRLELTEPSELQLNLAVGLDRPVDFVNTGVPHAVAWVDDVRSVDLPACGKLVREHERFAPHGTNANFAQVEADGSVTVRAYERGVEAETLACGTGATAAAVLAVERGWASFPVVVHCASAYDLIIDSVQGKITLAGSAVTVFDGEIEYGNRI